MRNQNQIIKQAEQFAENGNLSEAKELLLTEGYVKELNEEIQQAYLNLIPINSRLENELKTSLKEVFDDDSKKRFNALRYIHRQARRETHKDRKEWLRDPRTLDILLRVLEAETKENVVAETAGALSAIAFRYFPDLRIYNALKNLLDSKNKEVLYAAIEGVANYPFADKWDVLIPILEKNPTAKIKTVISTAIMSKNNALSDEKKLSLIPPLLNSFEKEKDIETKNRLVNAIAQIGNKSVVERLNELSAKESNLMLKERINSAIEVCREK